jgi:DNA-binding FadR family transcriptional regulator
MLKASRSAAGTPATRTRSGTPVTPPRRAAPRGAIALVQSSSLPMLVQKELERMILTGEQPAGSKLNEAAIAARLGVSRGPVREAFRALEESGLVRLQKNRGVYVRRIPSRKPTRSTSCALSSTNS